MKPCYAIRHPWMTKTVERAQKSVEENNFEIRRNLLKYDEVMNQQREVIYSYRRSVLKGYSLKREVQEMIEETIDRIISENISFDSSPDEWNLARLTQWFKSALNVAIEPEDLESDHLSEPLLRNTLKELILQAYEKKEEQVGSESMREIERRCLLEVVDEEWRDHLHEMDLLKEGVYLRAYAEKDPLIEYKRESFKLFQNLISRIQENVTKKVFTTYILTQEQVQNMMKDSKLQHENVSAFLKSQELRPGQQNMSEPPNFSEPDSGIVKQKPIRVAQHVGRNDPCPCGSGKKYKKCCGRFENDE